SKGGDYKRRGQANWPAPAATFQNKSLLALLENHDLFDLAAVSCNLGSDTFFGVDLREHFVLQAAFDGVTSFHLLGVLVEHALYHLHIVGHGKRLLFSLLRILALPFQRGECHFAIFYFCNHSPNLFRKGKAHEEKGDNRRSDDLSQHVISLENGENLGPARCRNLTWGS